jgi:arylsulfatase A-like enzyme
MMKTTIKLSLLLLPAMAIQSCSCISKDKPTEKPNIIIILSDDMGFSDLGCYGGEISTPNLDALANNGVRFTQFYNTARCCPTRASLLTGLHPHQAGMGYMQGKSWGTSVAYQDYLREDRKTIAEIMKLGGYTTLHVGKWHVGSMKDGAMPSARGFDRAWATGGAIDFWNLKQVYEDGEMRDLKEEEKKFGIDVKGDKAIEYIDWANQKEAPFFMYLAFNAAHWPMMAKPEDIAKYRGKYMKGWDQLRLERIKRLEELGMVVGTDPDKIVDDFVPRWDDIPEGDMYPGYHELRSGKHDQDDWDSKMAVYAAMIDCMDQNIGRIIEKLKETGQFENTLIMFLQDNGACAERINRKETDYPGGPNTYSSYDLPWAYLSNTPFRMYKHFLHEGGMSTPFIVHWPDGIKDDRKGEIEKESFGQLIDLVPTCMEAAGIEDAEIDYELEGMSLLSTIRDIDENSDRELFWEHEGNRCVRKGDWKLVSRYEKDFEYFGTWGFPIEPRTQEWELYNVKEDRWEMNEVSSQHPALVEEMKKDYEAYYKKVGAIPRDELLNLDKK